MLLLENLSQLVLVDYQSKLMSQMIDTDLVLKNATVLAKLAKKLRVPIYGTEQTPSLFGDFDTELATFCKARLRKVHFSACPEGLLDMLTESESPPAGNARSLPKHLQKKNQQEPRQQIVIAGVEAHVSLLQTALDLLDQELCVWVVTDACSSRSERSRDAAFDRLAGNGAELLTTEMVVFEWLESSDNEHFSFASDLLTWSLD